MLDWMILPFKRYAEFSGRSRRMEYWSFFLLNAIVMTVLVGMVFAGGLMPLITAMADPAMTDPSTITPEAPGPLLYIGGGLLGIYWLAVLIPSIAVTVRRFHDRDMSGWWYLGFIVASFVPVVGSLAGIALLVLMLLPGTLGPNRFGPDPKDPTGAEVFT